MSELRRMKILFAYSTYFDYDQNGTVDENDITVATEKLAELKNLKRGEPKHEELVNNITKVWKGMMEHADANADGIVTPEEWLKMWLEFGQNPNNPKKWMIQYRDLIYNLFDLDSDGFITLEEFVKVYTFYGLDKDDVEQAFKKSVGDKNIMTKQEFHDYWTQYFTSDDKNSPGNFLLGTTKY